MKKVSKLFFVITVICMLLLANCSYATEAQNVLEGNATTADDMVIDGTMDELYSSNSDMLITEDDGIMLINEEDGEPISEDGAYLEDTLNSDAYIMNKDASLTQNVTGNVYIMGQNAEVSADWISGNVFAMGENVTIKGNIGGSLYVMGKTVNIETKGVATVYAMAETLNLGNDANIVNDLKATAETININGNIYRELYVAGKDVNVSNIAGYVSKGKVYYSDSYTDPNGILSNTELIKTEDSEKIENTVRTAIAGATIRSQIINLISAVLVIVVIYFIARNKLSETEGLSVGSIAKTILAGLGWLVFTPFVFIILLCTVVGVPFAIILLVVYCIALYISAPVASVKLGSLVSNELKQQNKLMALVSAICVYVVIELVSMIPTLGGIIKFLVVLYGLGTFMNSIFLAKKVEKKEIEEEVKEDAIDNNAE